MRLDKYLVDKSYFESRNKAQNEIKAGNVCINNKVVLKESYEVLGTDIVTVNEESTLKYVSKGGLKLEKALDYFKIDVKGKTCLDIGLSTGGFTDCLLQNGAMEVYGIDTGTDQLHESLRNDKRVHPYEQTNFLSFDLNLLPKIDLITIDVSFTKVETILEKVVKSFKDVQVVFLIKPQFELGMNYFKNGIVKDNALHNKVINQIISFLKEKGISCQDAIESPIRGGSGNKEFLSTFKL